MWVNELGKMDNLRSFMDLATSICRQSIQDRFGGSVLGGFWIFVWPLVQMGIYILIFGQLMGHRLGVDGKVYSYGIYLGSGLLAWTCFTHTLQKTMRSLIDRRHIIVKVAMDLRVFPVAVNMEELVPYFAAMALLVLINLFSGWHPDLLLLLLAIFALYCQQLLASGLGMAFACLAVFNRDLLELVNIGMQITFWFTPIVYLPSILPDWLASLLWINPMTAITGIYQQCFVLGGSVHWVWLLYAAIWAHAAFLLGMYMFSHWKKAILDVL